MPPTRRWGSPPTSPSHRRAVRDVPSTPPDRPWRRIGPAALHPADAVARPVALLAHLGADGPAVASWSTTTSTGLVLGRSASTPTIDRQMAARHGITVVRRSSGGGPVLWDAGLVGLDILLPPGHRLAPADVVATYRWLGEALATALRAIGLPQVEVITVDQARADAQRPVPAHAACYGGLSPFEVTVEGRKVVGLSQARRRAGTLLQAGVLISLDPHRLGELMEVPADFPHSLGARAAGLGEWLPNLATTDVIREVDRAVAAVADVNMVPDGPTEAEQGAVRRLRIEMLNR